MKPRIVGTPVLRPLASVRPNGWNPNVMTAAQTSSLRWGLQHEGWLASQALLVWASDKKGVAKNLIIDGEHRWQEASALGFVEGPMVLLEKISERQAKTLTLKLDALRGNFAEAPLALIVKELHATLGEAVGLQLGFDTEQVMKLLALPPALSEGPSIVPGAGRPSSPPVVSANAHTNQVPLFLDDQQKASFVARIERLRARFNTETVSDTVSRALEQAVEQL